MRKITLIAKCLVEGGHISQLTDAEAIAQRYICDEFPQLDFNEWNTCLDPEQSELFLAQFTFQTPVQLDRLVKAL